MPVQHVDEASLATGRRTRMRQPVAQQGRGEWPISHALARLDGAVFGFTRMEIVTKQFEVSQRTVPRCRCVLACGGSPSQKGSEGGTRR